MRNGSKWRVRCFLCSIRVIWLIITWLTPPCSHILKCDLWPTIISQPRWSQCAMIAVKFDIVPLGKNKDDSLPSSLAISPCSPSSNCFLCFYIYQQTNANLKNPNKASNESTYYCWILIVTGITDVRIHHGLAHSLIGLRERVTSQFDDNIGILRHCLVFRLTCK